MFPLHTWLCRWRGVPARWEVGGESQWRAGVKRYNRSHLELFFPVSATLSVVAGGPAGKAVKPFGDVCG